MIQKEKGSLSFWLVYSSELSVRDAIASSYRLASKDQFSEVALFLRKVIMKAHKEAEELPWPPTAEEIACRSDEQVPIDLKRFLNLVLSGNEKETSEKTLRLVVSIGQDVCRTVSNGEW